MPKTDSLHKQILDVIPGYRNAIERRETLRKLMRTNTWVGDFEATFRAKIADAVDTGATNLDDLRAEYTAARQEWKATGEFNVLITNAYHDADNAVAQTLSGGTAAALDYLRVEMDTLMADVRKNRDVITAHPSSAEQALDTPSGAKNWRTVTSLLGRYADLRNEHHSWIRRDGNIKGFEVCGQFTKLLADPHWQYRRATSPGKRATDSQIAAWFAGGTTKPNPTQSWPEFVASQAKDATDVDRPDIWPQSVRPNTWLLIVADNDPWLPDADTIAEVHRITTELFTRPMTESADNRWFYRLISELAQYGVDLGITAPPTSGVRETSWQTA
ncbi:hypothetical protein [Mycolicibacterium mengxianglii]|uniref:hypothetical protein n=1 Tax=Mycolicibacterium mengxianglii TaxID=2736649 RepID=UPI0018CFF4D3|nr:hypothetical protein [Mycolicibacterium mengxianglii]